MLAENPYVTGMLATHSAGIWRQNKEDFPMLDITDYLASIAPERRAATEQLHHVITAALQPGFVAQLTGKTLEYVVPLSYYPLGYHTTAHTPLPYVAIINQKSHLGVYAFCVYSSSPLHDRFAEDYRAATGRNVDMGAACIRLKRMEDIPYALFGALAGHFSIDGWIATYEASLPATVRARRASVTPRHAVG